MYNHLKRIKDFDSDAEIVGYYRNYGQYVSITVREVKEYVPREHWGMTMSSAVRELKELNSN